MSAKQNKTVYVLKKSRSSRASFTAAIDLFVSNIKTCFLSLWPPVLLGGVIVAVLFALLRVASPQMYLVECGLATVLLTYIVAVVRETIVKILSTYDATHELTLVNWKCKSSLEVLSDALLPFYMLMAQVIVVGGLAALVFFVLHPQSLLVPISFGVVVMFLTVPFNYGLNYLQFGHLGFLKSFLKGFAAIKRYYGSGLILLFLSFVLIALLSAVCFLPLFILNLAINASDTAVQFGDPTDLPSYVFVLHFALSVVLTFVIVFAFHLWIVPQYFHYHSMEKKDADRQKELEKRNMTRELYRQARMNNYLSDPKY